MTVDSVLVVGATGTQGGAVANLLLETDAEVHALTRNPDGDAAQALADRGATIVEGNLDDPDSYRDAVETVDGVYLVTNFWEHGYDDEVEHGENMVDVVADVGVEHLVFSSVGGAERDTGIDHFDSKYEIEAHIDERGVPATIVRPVYFMQNFEAMRDDIEDGTLTMALDRHVPLQMIDVAALGGVVAQIFDEGDEHVGEAYELASDELTLEAMALRFERALEQHVAANHISVEQMREAMGEEYAVMFEWFNDHGYEADLTGLRARFDAEFNGLETYLDENGWGR